jgi:RND family efflux transporter MFP subunit
MRRTICIILTGLSLTFTGGKALAEEEKKPANGPPPMLVTTTEIVVGKAAPTATFVGTIYFSRTAKVAAEVDGIVLKVYSDDGQEVKAGDRLVRLDDDLMATEIAGTRAVYEQNLVELEQAQRDYKRIEALHQEDSIATSEYESYGTRVNRLQKQSTVLNARLDRLLLEKKKKTVRAPFDGMVIETLVEAGEWVNTGGSVATIADNSNLEVRVDIPAALIHYLKPGRVVSVTVAGEARDASYVTLVPKGDLATRTFTAKFKMAQDPALFEGMEATTILPTATAVDGLLVPRDAVINQFGRDVIFLAEEGMAKMIPVEVEGYQGMQAAVTGAGLEAGQQVVIKGNERIRDGQPVRF